MSWIGENLQKISGSLTAMLGFAMTGIAAGQLDKVIGDSKDVWLFFLGMAITGLGGVTVTKASSVTAKVKVAEAMKAAIEAEPANTNPQEKP